jgi:superfamily II RNA helicase
VIFDEIHQIGEVDSGTVWEHLLLLIECPFLALSATVGNKEYFGAWLNSVQSTLETQHKARKKSMIPDHPPSHSQKFLKRFLAFSFFRE